MAINLIAVEKKNMRTQAVKWYAQVAPVRGIEAEVVIEEIEKRCTLTSSDIKACLDALQQSILSRILNGESVRLGDLGSFRATVRSEGRNTKELVDSTLVKGIRCRFAPSGYLRSRLKKGSLGVRLSMQTEKPAATEEETPAP